MNVSVPYALPQIEVDRFLRQKARWIFQKITEIKVNRVSVRKRTFDDGGEFLFLGKSHQLRVHVKDVKKAAIGFDDTGWTISVPAGLSVTARQRAVKSKLIQWYRRQAEEILGSRVFHYSRIMNIEPKKIAVRSFKRVWGNCDYRAQKIQLNWQIVLSPIQVIDYVVVHELCHLFHPNHSKRFWKKVEGFMPDFKEHKKWLNAHMVDMVFT